jgi:hypothetical protein
MATQRSIFENFAFTPNAQGVKTRFAPRIPHCNGCIGPVPSQETISQNGTGVVPVYLEK